MWALELIGGNYSKQLGVAIQTTAISVFASKTINIHGSESLVLSMLIKHKQPQNRVRRPELDAHLFDWPLTTNI